MFCTELVSWMNSLVFNFDCKSQNKSTCPNGKKFTMHQEFPGAYVKQLSLDWKKWCGREASTTVLTFNHLSHEVPWRTPNRIMESVSLDVKNPADQSDAGLHQNTHCWYPGKKWREMVKGGSSSTIKDKLLRMGRVPISPLGSCFTHPLAVVSVGCQAYTGWPAPKLALKWKKPPHSSHLGDIYLLGREAWSQPLIIGAY